MDSAIAKDPPSGAVQENRERCPTPRCLSLLFLKGLTKGIPTWGRQHRLFYAKMAMKKGSALCRASLRG